MVDQRLIDFIKNTLKKGYSEQQIKKALIEKGWQQSQVDEAFNTVRSPIQIKELKDRLPQYSLHERIIYRFLQTLRI